ncbi:hypothetical protein NEUTE2DRAFT_111856 [Neurospora tetrasperma FGSC 2509]|nr:hypothetical protein NEUTE2DRAFT_111856 [Neurospora tetrasperma FGSC 2509]
MTDQDSKPRVTIALGTSSSSSSFKTKKPSRPTHTRRHHAGASSNHYSSESEDDDDETGGQRTGRVQAITEISTYGDDNELKSRDRSDRRDRSRDRDRNRDGDRNRDRRRDRSQDRDRHNRSSRPSRGDASRSRRRSTSRSRDRDHKPRDPKDLQEPETAPPKWEEKPPQTLEEQALSSLLSLDNKGSSTTSKRKRSHSPSSHDRDRSPDHSDYRAVPIDDFGATLLKQFGWDGKMRGKVKEVTHKHANLAGLGAKDAKGAEELDAWNQKISGRGGGDSRGRDSRPVRLEDYRREENNKKQRMEYRHGESSYKQEREREREQRGDR